MLVDPPPDSRVRSQPGTIHLMLWILCTAVILAISRPGEENIGGMPERYSAMQRITYVVSAMVTGLEVVGTLVLLKTWRPRHSGLLDHPGHWLLVIGATSDAAWAVLAAGYRWLSPGDATSFYRVYGGYVVLVGGAYGLAGLRGRCVKWKLPFWTFAAFTTLHGLCWLILGVRGPLFSSWLHLPAMIVGPWILVLAIYEHRTRRRRDWLHGLGVCAYCAGWSMNVSWFWLVR